MFRVIRTFLTLLLVVFILMIHKSHAGKSTTNHSRQKRGYGAVFRGALAAAAWGGYSANIGFTIYHAVRKCNDYTPRSCNAPSCKYLEPCPDVCQGPDENRKLSLKLKKETQEKLDLMDDILLNVYNRAVGGNKAFINNKRIANAIKQISDNFDSMMFSIVELDPNILKKFSNKSLEIKAMILDRNKSLRDIIISPEVQGIFDKWTWKGTGRFALSIGFTLGVTLFSSLSERYAIHKIYTEMKADFSRRFVNQGPSVHNNKAKFRSRFAALQGYSSNAIDAQIKQTAKSIYRSNQVSRTQEIITKYVTPLINGVYLAFSIWDSFKQWKECQDIADKMRDTSIKVITERDKLEGIMETEVDPLEQEVNNRTWKPVINWLRNSSLQNMLEEIKYLTLEVNNKSTAVNTITYFLQNIGQANTPHTVIQLQNQLLLAFEEIEFRLRCVAEKEHAVVVAITKCRAGWDTLEEIFTFVTSTLKLNREKCIEGKMVPQTSQKDLQLIVEEIANKKGWYSNCLLNNNNLLLSVCNKKYKGYSTPEIIKQTKNMILTENLVNNFLARCPTYQIIPKAIICKLYCRYETPQQIASYIGFSESQVKTVIEGCYYKCTVSARMETEICALHFCKGENVSSIESKVRFPWRMVNHVINENCQKCILNENEKAEVCDHLKCKGFGFEIIARQLDLPLMIINKMTLNDCDIILPDCGPVSPKDQRLILLYHCHPLFNYSAEQIFMDQSVYGVSVLRIQKVINSADCKEFLASLFSG